MDFNEMFGEMVYAKLMTMLENKEPIKFLDSEIEDIDLKNVMHVLAAVYTMGAGDAYVAIIEATKTAVEDLTKEMKESEYRNLFGLN